MKAVFFGSGNLATHLSLALQAKGVEIVQVYSRTRSNARILAEALNSNYTSDLAEIDKSADIYFYALKDSYFLKLLERYELPDAIHVHTAGSISMNYFKGRAANYGVFYPLQTFSKKKEIDFSKIPVCIEASSPEVQEKLTELAGLLTPKVYNISSEQRKKLHLAAVFACNFTNYMYDIAYEILEDAGLGFEIIQPLINETAEKVKTIVPYEAQTGPAVRFDETTISRHLTLLRRSYDLRKIYRLLSKSIYKRHK